MKVLITGATGTLGQELIERFYNEWEIVAYSRDELKQAKLEFRYPKVKYVIGDVRDYERVYGAMEGVDAVIHAAAMKRIEVCERDPVEAVKTNVIGTENVARAAINRGIRRAIVIGSDKGVEPVNAYGMTKALQEKIFTSYGYNSARYGNVFGSRGSVVPLFKEWAAAGRTLRVTDPEMTRFILTAEDAINLIMVAFNSPMQGDVFVKQSPAARLSDIAAAFSSDIQIVGKMPGEKLHESLIAPEEFTRSELLDEGYVVIRRHSTGMAHRPAYTSDTERLLTPQEIRNLADSTVPDYEYAGVR